LSRVVLASLQASPSQATPRALTRPKFWSGAAQARGVKRLGVSVGLGRQAAAAAATAAAIWI
jgi:hypothetical protein